ENRNNLQYAKVYLDGDYKGKTDNGGYLRISDVSEGYHTVEARKSGYEEGGKKIYVESGETETVYLYLKQESEVAANIYNATLLPNYICEREYYIFETGNYVEVAYYVENTGTKAYHFYFGFSVEDEYGKSWDAPYKSSTISPGKSYGVLLRWKVPSYAPRCRYKVHIAVWGKESGGYLYDELDRKVLNRRFSVADQERIGKVDVWFEGRNDNGVARLCLTNSALEDVAYKCCWYAQQIIDKSKEKGYTVVKSRNNMAEEIFVHVLCHIYEEDQNIPKERRHGNPIDIELYTGRWIAPNWMLDTLIWWLEKGGGIELILHELGFDWLTAEIIKQILKSGYFPCPPW
ncbi:MAG: PEGA domain-containing protein, partial [Candidatus Methanofastidiosia archaeon]